MNVVVKSAIVPILLLRDELEPMFSRIHPIPKSRTTGEGDSDTPAQFPFADCCGAGSQTDVPCERAERGLVAVWHAA